MRIKTPTPPSSPVESQKNYSAVVRTVEPPPLLLPPFPHPSSAMPNSAKKSTSLQASIDPNLFKRTLCARNSPPPNRHYISGHSTTTSTKMPQPIVQLPPLEVPVPSLASVPVTADIRGFITETKDALLTRGIRKISGAIKCGKCRNQSIIDLDLPEDLSEIANFIISNKRTMEGGNYGLTSWYYPNLLNCPKCGAIANSRPVLKGSVNDISWLFLFLGKLLGICSKDQLYYYWVSVCPGCKKTLRKDDLLFSVFTHILGLLDPGRLCD
ncbi:hypothetical protein SLE2022_076000 [Rubroshorea leprosula]